MDFLTSRNSQAKEVSTQGTALLTFEKGKVKKKHMLPPHALRGPHERRQKRILCVLRILSITYIVTGILTTVTASLLVIFALDEPKFTFSTGLPLMVGIMVLLGSMILLCISLKGSRFRVYTSPRFCKWQCALLFFCHIGVLSLGTASLILTFTFNQVTFSLIKNSNLFPAFPLGLGATVLTFVDVVGVLCSVIFFSVHKRIYDLHRGLPRCTERQRYNEELIQREVNSRLRMLSRMLPRYENGHVLNTKMDMTSSVVQQKHPQIDRKGYYVWEPI